MLSLGWVKSEKGNQHINYINKNHIAETEWRNHEKNSGITSTNENGRKALTQDVRKEYERE